MSDIACLRRKQRELEQQIRDAESHLDQIAIALEDLRNKRDLVKAAVRDEVMGLSIAQACSELADSILDAEVIS